ncbi:hypothetical protein ACMD2_25380 [Ananas comosus]|uniref:Uncharacterized protein n=1 Tax=Ananas comosus TaxID=4615 RepID=A0A199UQ74_ANACO|nr:hypothetical protein ACMD2_25380 [Ananas comosus]
MEKCLCICRSPSNLLLLDSYYTDSKMKDNNKKSPLLLSDIEQLQCIGGAKSCASKDNSNDIVNGQESCAKAGYGDNYQKRNCGCSELDDITEHYRKSLVRNGNWIHLLYKSARVFSKEAKQIPQLHHLHQQDCIFTVCDTHIASVGSKYCASLLQCLWLQSLALFTYFFNFSARFFGRSRTVFFVAQKY